MPLEVTKVCGRLTAAWKRGAITSEGYYRALETLRRRLKEQESKDKPEVVKDLVKELDGEVIHDVNNNNGKRLF